MKEKKPEEINNWLLRATLDCIKDETSLDIDLSACAPIPSVANGNSMTDFWETELPDESLSKRMTPGGMIGSRSSSDIIDADYSKNMKHESASNRITTAAIEEPTFQTGDGLKGDELSQGVGSPAVAKKRLKPHKSTRKDSVINCPTCGKQLKLSSMWMHRKIHNDSERFSCDICGQKFVQKINLIHHTKAHLGEKPFECPQCQKTFPERSHLMKHQRYHASTRQYKCEKCGKMYKTERCLKVHNLVHLEQRPFVCTECNKSFISSSKLKQHSNIHTGERPYKCKYCARDFTNFPNWLKHTRRRHKVDHKTGELLQTIPNYTSKPKQSDKKEKKTKAKKVGKEAAAVETTNMTNYTDIYALSLNSAEELIMEQALEMEESGYLMSPPSDTFMDMPPSPSGFQYYRPIQTDTFQDLPPSPLSSNFPYYTPSLPTISNTSSIQQNFFSTTSSTLPSVETLFASSFQKSSLPDH